MIGLKFGVTDNEVKQVANGLSIGDLSSNVDWMGIQKIGVYLSPVGTDNPHTVSIFRTSQKNVIVASIRCTNSIYSEWIKCLCKTIWHTQSVVLYDIHNNPYPMGDMTGMDCTIEYHNVGE